MKSILITGCNRGIGLGLVKKLAMLPNAPQKIIATCRDINKATALTDVAKQTNTIKIIEIDLRDTNNYANFVEDVKNNLEDIGLNVLFNNAGTGSKFHRIGLVRDEDLLNSYKINTVAPIMLSKALLPLLKKASSKTTDKSMGISKAAIINMSSILGSISDNDIGGYYSYRCSKAALNIATKSLSADLKNDGIMAISLHPGWVKTDMGGPNATITVEQSVDNIVKVLQIINETHNGTFIDYTGKKINW